MKTARCINLALISANLLLAAAASQWLGCATAPSADELKAQHSYTPDKAARQIDAGGARILYAADFTYGQNTAAFWGGPENQGSYKLAMNQVILSDLSQSDLFTQPASVTTLDPALAPADAAQREKAADYELRAPVVLNYDPQTGKTTYMVTLEVVDIQSGTIIKSYSSSADGQPEVALKSALAEVKRGLLEDFGGEDFRKVCAQSVHPDPADLESLLVAKDFSVTVGRSRNRALIAANTVTLPGILQDKKTADLVSIKVKMEQAIFDLTHEAEVAKETAESDAAAGRSAGELREQSLVYSERIEILKPMLAALKDEIANRAR